MRWDDEKNSVTNANYLHAFTIVFVLLYAKTIWSTRTNGLAIVG